MLGHALEELAALSKAKVGDKTMMDALTPATEAALACQGSADEVLPPRQRPRWRARRPAETLSRSLAGPGAMERPR